tara:strand:- start:837 stop:1490 length:654 start_codon:yes stop_codon:yes gene_type:complete
MTDNLPTTTVDPELSIQSDEEIFSEEEVVDDSLLKPVPNDNLDTSEVFTKSKRKKVIVEGAPQVKKVITLTKTGKQRKPMTPEHKAKLNAARIKGLEKRREMAIEKKALKELEKQASEKTTKKKKKELEDIVNDVQPEPPKPVKAEISPDVIQKAIDEALFKAEQLRLARKAEKKAKQNEEVQRKKHEEQIKQMVYPPSQLYYGSEGFASKHIFNLQ